MVLFERNSSGGFASISDFQVGCHLADLDNIFLNTEKLSAVLGKIDGITTATALYQLFQKFILWFLSNNMDQNSIITYE